MASNTENGKNGKYFQYLLFTAIILGGFGTYNSTGADVKVEKLIDNLDEVLQREIILRIEPLKLSVERLVIAYFDHEQRINELEEKVAMLEERTKP